MNQALLARQCWRILNNPNSLCTRLLKSIYFPKGEFLDTVFKRDASPSWQGIEHGLQLLKEGIIHRIGNGKGVNIWRDNWIPRDHNLRASAGKTNTRIRRVNQLLLPGTNTWDESLVRNIFFNQDAEWILKMKLPTEPYNDRLAWHYDKSGMFSVRSAYRLAFNIKHGIRWRPGNSSLIRCKRIYNF